MLIAMVATFFERSNSMIIKLSSVIGKLGLARSELPQKWHGPNYPRSGNSDRFWTNRSKFIRSD